MSREADPACPPMLRRFVVAINITGTPNLQWTNVSMTSPMWTAANAADHILNVRTLAEILMKLGNNRASQGVFVTL